MAPLHYYGVLVTAGILIMNTRYSIIVFPEAFFVSGGQFRQNICLSYVSVRWRLGTAWTDVSAPLFHFWITTVRVRHSSPFNPPSNSTGARDSASPGLGEATSAARSGSFTTAAVQQSGGEGRGTERCNTNQWKVLQRLLPTSFKARPKLRTPERKNRPPRPRYTFRYFSVAFPTS